MWMEYPKKLFCSNADAGVPVGVPPSRSLPCQRSNSLRDFKLAIFTVTAIHRGGGTMLVTLTHNPLPFVQSQHS